MQVKKLTLIVGLITALGCIAAVKVDAPVYVTKSSPTSADYIVITDAADGGKQKKSPMSLFPALAWGTGLSTVTADGVTTVKLATSVDSDADGKIDHVDLSTAGVVQSDSSGALTAGPRIYVLDDCSTASNMATGDLCFEY